MNQSPGASAEQASLNAFINCYIREIDRGQWKYLNELPAIDILNLKITGNTLIELRLACVDARVLLELSYQSLVGRHHFGKVFIRMGCESGKWQVARPTTVMILMIREIYQAQQMAGGSEAVNGLEVEDHIRRNELQLLARLIDSLQLMTHYLEARHCDCDLGAINFIDTEQLALLGHWLHPTPKSRMGMTYWQQAHYAPELKGEFQLHFFAVDRALVHQASNLRQSASEIVLSEARRYTDVQLAENEVLVPVHPLQATWLLLQQPIQDLAKGGRLRNLGPMAAFYRATSSVRTVYNDQSEWMFKFSIPVKITNSLRNNKFHELKVGLVVGKLMRNSGFLDAHKNFRIVEDPAFLTVNLPGMKESGFEVIVRRNEFAQQGGQGICSVLALVQEPLPTGGDLPCSLLKRIIVDLSMSGKRSLRATALTWFDRYFSCAIEPLIRLYDDLGVALEAHQQNSLLDLSEGYPRRFYYRDNQGFYLSNRYRDLLTAMEPQTTEIAEMFYDDSIIFEGIAYYMFINQLFSVIYRLGADRLVSEELLIERVANRLHRLRADLTGVGGEFVDHLLGAERLAYKANLLARINDVDELQAGMERRVYTSIANPLANFEFARQGSIAKAKGSVYVA